MKVKNYLLIIITSLLLSACATGTGTKTLPTSINTITGGDKVVLYFSRPKVYVGSGVAAQIKVNGFDAGILGHGEYVEYATDPGNFTINIKPSGFHLGMGGDSTSGTGSSGDRFFYIVDIKESLLSLKFRIMETTESGFKQSQ